MKFKGEKKFHQRETLHTICAKAPANGTSFPFQIFILTLASYFFAFLNRVMELHPL